MDMVGVLLQRLEKGKRRFIYIFGSPKRNRLFGLRVRRADLKIVVKI